MRSQQEGPPLLENRSIVYAITLLRGFTDVVLSKKACGLHGFAAVKLHGMAPSPITCMQTAVACVATTNLACSRCRKNERSGSSLVLFYAHDQSMLEMVNIGPVHDPIF